MHDHIEEIDTKASQGTAYCRCDVRSEFGWSVVMVDLGGCLTEGLRLYTIYYTELSNEIVF